MTTKRANELTTADRVCEADGFMWQIDAIEARGSVVVLSLSPVCQTMLREQPCQKRVRGTSLVYVA